MKVVKKIGLALGVIILVLFVLALFLPREFTYEKSIIIDAPVDEVWEYTSSLEGMDKWSPWNDYDPDMKKTLSGTDGTIGAKSSWESDHEKVGRGSQTISKIKAPNHFQTKIKFLTPYESEAVAQVRLYSQGDQTKVVWAFSGEMPYPFNLMQLTMNMDVAIGEDFDNGLYKLKMLCENP